MRVTASTSMTDEVLEREADSLPYGVPLPKPKFAKGSEEEIPQSHSASSGKVCDFGMTILNFEFRISNFEFKIISHFSFSIPNLQKNRPRLFRRR